MMIIYLRLEASFLISHLMSSILKTRHKSLLFLLLYVAVFSFVRPVMIKRSSDLSVLRVRARDDAER